MKRSVFITLILFSVILFAEGARNFWVLDRKHQSNSPEVISENLNIITWVDKQTGVNYIVTEARVYNSYKHSYTSDTISVTMVPRLNPDGTLFVSKVK